MCARVFGFGGRTLVYEWDHCQLDVRNVRNASKRPFKFKKEDFALYKSDEVHTKPTNKVPTVVKMFFILLMVLLWWAIKRFGADEAQGVPSADAGVSAVATEIESNRDDLGLQQVDLSRLANSRGERDDRPMTVEEYAASFLPRIVGMQHTAPRYDELTRPQRAPLPVSCIKMEKKGCKCYTQDATPYKVTTDICEQIVDGGIFLDFLPEREVVDAGVEPVPKSSDVQAPESPRSSASHRHPRRLPPKPLSQ